MIFNTIGCVENEKTTVLTALEIASQYLEMVKKNQFEKASDLIIKNDENQDLFIAYQQLYNQLDKKNQQAISHQSINIIEWNESDSAASLTYEDPLLQRKAAIGLIKHGKTWEIDLQPMHTLLEKK